MDSLSEARKTISEIDEQTAKLFEKRMEAVKAVAEYKKEHGIPIEDREREDALICKNSALIDDEEVREYFVSFQRSTMDISKRYQHRLLEGMKVAYSGVEGAYAYIAAKKVFRDAEKISFRDFAGAYNAVVNGECDCAVLPIENSNAGEVGAVLDLMFGGSLFVNAVYSMAIYHNLIALPGARIEDIKRVISHQQALDQCDAFIRKYGFETQSFPNTARAAQFVAGGDDKTVAAIASRDTAKLYGLDILREHINESDYNTTRFAVFSRSMHQSKEASHSVIIFSVPEKAGALAKAVNVIGNHGYNMRCIKSRATKGEMWTYYFYAEIEGNLQSKRGKYMLDELSDCTKTLKFVGTFSEAAAI